MLKRYIPIKEKTIFKELSISDAKKIYMASKKAKLMQIMARGCQKSGYYVEDLIGNIIKNNEDIYRIDGKGLDGTKINRLKSDFKDFTERAENFFTKERNKLYKIKDSYLRKLYPNDLHELPDGETYAYYEFGQYKFHLPLNQLNKPLRIKAIKEMTPIYIKDFKGMNVDNFTDVEKKKIVKPILKMLTRKNKDNITITIPYEIIMESYEYWLKQVQNKKSYYYDYD